MSTVRLRGRVESDGTLTFHLPTDLAGAEAEVTVEKRTSVQAPPLVARRESDSRLRKQHEALVAIAQSPLLSAGEEGAALRLVTETLARTLEVARASVWLYSEDRTRLRCEDVFAFKDRSHSAGDELLPATAPAFFDAVDREQIVVIANTYVDPRARELLTSHLRPWGVSALISAPIRRGGQTVGILRADHGGAPRLWHLEDQSFTVSLASTVALVLESDERRRVQAEIVRERETSERLLRNILPEAIAERLKRKPGIIADSFEDVTVLFADVVDFTRLASSISPGDLVHLLNDVFSTFDHLAEKHGVEKIKTIGDNYMAVCGLPSPRADHATAMAEMALEMRDEFARMCAERGLALRLRIGLHSGPVVAGVIGIKRFIYDLWGETVNTASRMESHGLPEKIQVSEATRHRIAGDFVWTERGAIDVKGVGSLRTYFLESRGTSG